MGTYASYAKSPSGKRRCIIIRMNFSAWRRLPSAFVRQVFADVEWLHLPEQALRRGPGARLLHPKHSPCKRLVLRRSRLEPPPQTNPIDECQRASFQYLQGVKQS